MNQQPRNKNTHFTLPCLPCVGWCVVGLLLGHSANVDAAVSVDVSSSFRYVATANAAGGYAAFPDVARLNDGRLMCMFYAGYGHISTPTQSWPNGGRIMGVTSTDEGVSWSAPQVLIDTPVDDRDPSLASLPDGRLLSTFFTYSSGNDASYVAESFDLGATWTTPRLLAPTPFFNSSPIRRLSTGRQIAPLYYEDVGTSAYGAVAFSDNDGADWSAPIDIPNPASLYADAETDLIELTNGNLWAVQRAANTAAQYSISIDQGESWSDSQPLGFAAHCPYLLRTEHEDMILMAYRGFEGGYAYTALRYSLDECQTWSDPIAIDLNCPGAYPSMVNLNDGSVLVAYYEEGAGSNIRARTIQISGLPEPGTWILLGTAIPTMAFFAWRKKRVK